MTPHAVLPVPIPAVIPVIVVVPTNVPAGLKTTLVHTPQQPNAAQLAVTVKTVLPEAAITQVHTPDLQNAEAAITVPIAAVPERKAAFPALAIMCQLGFLQPNAAPDVIPASIILIVP